MNRRQFLTNSAVVLGSVTSVAGAGNVLGADGQNRSDEAPARVGRPLRVVSIGFKPGLSLQQIAGLVGQEGARGTDLIVLPETCRGQNDQSPEGLDGPTVSTLAGLAARHRTYVVCPIDRKDGSRRLNSAVLVDRRGQITGVYDKIYP